MIIKKITGYPYKQDTEIIAGCGELKVEKYKWVYFDELVGKCDDVEKYGAKLLEVVGEYLEENQIIDTTDLKKYIEEICMYGDSKEVAHSEDIYFVSYRRDNIQCCIVALKTESHVYILNDKGDTIDKI